MLYFLDRFLDNRGIEVSFLDVDEMRMAENIDRYHELVFLRLEFFDHTANFWADLLEEVLNSLAILVFQNMVGVMTFYSFLEFIRH